MEAAAHVHLRGGPEAAGAARQALREQLEGRLDRQVLDDMQLLVSEVVTNGIRHGRGEIDVDVVLDRGSALVRCRDSGGGFEPVERPAPRDDGSGGYGLMLVDRLSRRWGVAREPGTCIWFELAT